MEVNEDVAPGYHSMSILPVSPTEYNVTCENRKCPFNVTKPTRDAAKAACFDHLRELLGEQP